MFSQSGPAQRPKQAGDSEVGKRSGGYFSSVWCRKRKKRVEGTRFFLTRTFPSILCPKRRGKPAQSKKKRTRGSARMSEAASVMICSIKLDVFEARSSGTESQSHGTICFFSGRQRKKNILDFLSSSMYHRPHDHLSRE